MAAPRDLDRCYCELLNEEGRQHIGEKAVADLETMVAEHLGIDYKAHHSQAKFPECLERRGSAGEQRLHTLLAVDVLLTYCECVASESTVVLALLARARDLLSDFALDAEGVPASFYAATNALASRLHTVHFRLDCILAHAGRYFERERFKAEEPVAFEREQAWQNVRDVLREICCQVLRLAWVELNALEEGKITERRYCL
jgi:hypothetical protein